MLHLHPAKHGKFIDRLVRKWEENENKIFQKNFKIYLPVKIIFLLLHPLWETSETKKKHVRRHIELTAALTEMLEQKNKE